MSKLSMIAGLLLLSVTLSSCASVSMVDTWRNPSLQALKLKKVLVVSITKKETSRIVFEDMLSSELNRRGVEAVAAHTMIPAVSRSDWNMLSKTVKDTSAQAVLTLQTIKVVQETVIQPGYVTTYPGHWYPEAFPAWDLYGYYGSMANYGPAYVSTYDVATMQANLFDARSGKLLWAGTLESDEPEKVVPVGKELARLIVESLAREGLI
ncbi:MAG TPA: DUF4136 domain-containing protein [Geomonas sp.]|nr:DUF4136 domain-containing protein [Geomonas sp.]